MSAPDSYSVRAALARGIPATAAPDAGKIGAEPAAHVAAPKVNSVRLTLPPLPRYEGTRTGIPSLDRATLNGLPS